MFSCQGVSAETTQPEVYNVFETNCKLPTINSSLAPVQVSHLNSFYIVRESAVGLDSWT